MVKKNEAGSSEAVAKPEVQEEVIFFNEKNENYRVGAEALQPEIMNQTGRIVQPSGVIAFYGHIHKTSDPEEIKYLKSLKDFELGRVRIITTDEHIKFMKSKASVVHMTASDAREVVEG